MNDAPLTPPSGPDSTAAPAEERVPDRDERSRAGALGGALVALSMSDSPDLARLGLLRERVDLAVAELARTVMVEGGRLLYGGDFRRAGLTPFLIKEVERWATQDTTYLYLCLASSVHRRMDGDEIDRAENLAGHFGEVLWLDDGGQPVEDPVAGRGWAGEVDERGARASLQKMRGFMVECEKARVLLGGACWRTASPAQPAARLSKSVNPKEKGKEKGAAKVPGVLEEAKLSLEARHPVYLAGGFGGATMELLRVMGLDPGPDLPALPAEPAPNEATQETLDALRRIGQQGWEALHNGLDDDSNRQLARTHRPGEIASLVGRGLREKFPPAPKP